MLQWLARQKIVSDLACILLNISVTWIVQAQGGPELLVGLFFMATFEGDIGMYSLFGNHLASHWFGSQGIIDRALGAHCQEYWAQFLVQNGPKLLENE